MLDAGGGGGGTPWESMTLDTMQLLIQNPNVEKHWELLTGWRRSADLINQHRSQVQSYRDNLAAVWPPEKNKAAAAYLARLDDLMANLTETYEAAVSNHTAFSTATLSLSLAQKNMAEIYREYTENAKVMAAYTLRKQEQEANGTPTPTPSPSGGEQPPVAPDRQEELRRQAVTLLSGVSGELAQAQVQIVTPTLYHPSRRINDPQSDDGGAFAAPPIPPITPIRASEATATRGITPSTRFPGGSKLPNPIAPTANQQPGLVLGGTNPSVGSSVQTSGQPIPSPAPPGNGLVSSTILPPGPNSSSNARPTIVPPATSRSGPKFGIPPEGITRNASPTPGAFHAMPPSGVIGRGPGVGVTGPTATQPGARHVNPVGGLIRDGLPARIDSHSANPHNGSLLGAPLSQAGGHNTSRQKQGPSRWDPDNPWAINHGVDPVVLPAREQRIDPGPAIGLH